MFEPSEGEPPDPPVLIGAVSNRNLGQTYVPLSFNAPSGAYSCASTRRPRAPWSANRERCSSRRLVTVTTGSLTTTVLGDRFVEPGTLDRRDRRERRRRFVYVLELRHGSAHQRRAVERVGGRERPLLRVRRIHRLPPGARRTRRPTAAACSGLKGHLVSITSAGENEVVRNLYLGMGLDDMRAWIGLTDPTGTFALVVGDRGRLRVLELECRGTDRQWRTLGGVLCGRGLERQRGDVLRQSGLRRRIRARVPRRSAHGSGRRRGSIQGPVSPDLVSTSVTRTGDEPPLPHPLRTRYVRRGDNEGKPAARYRPESRDRIAGRGFELHQ